MECIEYRRYIVKSSTLEEIKNHAKKVHKKGLKNSELIIHVASGKNKHGVNVGNLNQYNNALKNTNKHFNNIRLNKCNRIIARDKDTNNIIAIVKYPNQLKGYDLSNAIIKSEIVYI